MVFCGVLKNKLHKLNLFYKSALTKIYIADISSDVSKIAMAAIVEKLRDNNASPQSPYIWQDTRT
jgi:hypothetical protein